MVCKRQTGMHLSVQDGPGTCMFTIVYPHIIDVYLFIYIYIDEYIYIYIYRRIYTYILYIYIYYIHSTHTKYTSKELMIPDWVQETIFRRVDPLFSNRKKHSSCQSLQIQVLSSSALGLVPLNPVNHHVHYSNILYKAAKKQGD